MTSVWHRLTPPQAIIIIRGSTRSEYEYGWMRYVIIRRWRHHHELDIKFLPANTGTNTPATYMRLPSVPTLIRTFYTISNATTSRLFNPQAVQQTLGSSPFTRGGAIGLKSMPTVPFLSSLFSSSAQSKQMADYPVKKSDDEWRAVLNKGIISTDPLLLPPSSPQNLHN